MHIYSVYHLHLMLSQVGSSDLRHTYALYTRA